MFLKHKHSLEYHLRNTLHVFGHSGRKNVTSADVQATADNSNVRHKSSSSRQSSKLLDQKPTSRSSTIAPQQQAYNDYESRPSRSTTEARQRASPHVSSSTAASSLRAVLEHTNRDNECVFYDYKAVSDERPMSNLSKPLACSCANGFGRTAIRRWLANPASKLLALRLSTIHWVNGDEELLPPLLLSIKLPDERDHVVFFTKIDAARLSIQLSAVVEMRMTLRAIIELLASNCSGPILAITSDEDRKLRALELVVVCLCAP